MSSKTPKIQLGKRIDNDSLELVEVLGVGGYGVVYRAVETSSREPQSFAVKCLVHSREKLSNGRQSHIREIALHQISSAHPGIVTLHRVIEDHDCTYIIMDYAPGHDLFTQILNNCRYLGNDMLIKHVFLQLVDTVEYCHSLGIYHRDLKPENVLCFDDGSRVAITDFGLATTEKLSEELHTGSIYHMSPECQGGAFAPDGCYSPKSNDIWSLGIILLNLATGRNPWRTATTEDATFQAYLRDPISFFPSVLPVSPEMNDILLQMLHIDWKQRVTLPELRQQMEDVNSFYAPDVVFDGSQAKCAWEACTDTQRATSSTPAEVSPHTAPVEGMKSYWSEDSRSDIALTGHNGPSTVPPMKVPRLPGFETNGIVGLERQSSLDSSDSSHLSYSTSPSTPGSNDSALGTPGVMDLTMEDMFEKPKEREEYKSTGSGLMSEPNVQGEPTSSSSRFLARHMSTLDTLMADGDYPWLPADMDDDTTPSWALPGNRRSSLSSETSFFTSEMTFARSATPSPDTYACPCLPTLTATEADASRSNQDSKASFNPMKLFSRPSGQVVSLSPVESESVSGSEIPREGESRWRIPRLGSATKTWFSPVKLFS